MQIVIHILFEHSSMNCTCQCNSTFLNLKSNIHTYIYTAHYVMCTILLIFPAFLFGLCDVHQAYCILAKLTLPPNQLCTTSQNFMSSLPGLWKLVNTCARISTNVKRVILKIVWKFFSSTPSMFGVHVHDRYGSL